MHEKWQKQLINSQFLSAIQLCPSSLRRILWQFQQYEQSFRQTNVTNWKVDVWKLKKKMLIMIFLNLSWAILPKIYFCPNLNINKWARSSARIVGIATIFLAVSLEKTELPRATNYLLIAFFHFPFINLSNYGIFLENDKSN